MGCRDRELWSSGHLGHMAISNSSSSADVLDSRTVGSFVDRDGLLDDSNVDVPIGASITLPFAAHPRDSMASGSQSRRSSMLVISLRYRTRK
jgi:hypothetical protein